MKLYNTAEGITLNYREKYYRIDGDWDSQINDNDLFDKLDELSRHEAPLEDGESLIATGLRAPIGSQEVWAAGVTYLRSKQGRQEESLKGGGADFYQKVYEADRPELFFKAPACRVVGSGEKVRIRRDSIWNVPEPELTLMITSRQKIIGYTIGNDMSSRSIEGENPLYLPQAKTYDGCAAVGPCLYITEDPLPEDTRIDMQIIRNNDKVFTGNVGINQIKRSFEELVSYLFRECTFPQGCWLMTGTGIVPTSEFTLQSGDEIRITIDNIGTLINEVE